MIVFVLKYWPKLKVKTNMFFKHIFFCFIRLFEIGVFCTIHELLPHSLALRTTLFFTTTSFVLPFFVKYLVRHNVFIYVMHCLKNKIFFFFNFFCLFFLSNLLRLSGLITKDLNPYNVSLGTNIRLDLKCQVFY